MINDLLLEALADAGVTEHTAVLLLVPGGPTDDVAEFAYLPPGQWGANEHRVLHDAEPEISEQPYASCHRLAAYEHGTLPEAGLPVGLRHEAEHASIFDRHGRPFFELESILRRTQRDADRVDEYTQIPSERLSNRAAATFAHAKYPNAVAGLSADVRTQQFVAEARPVADLIGETAEMIWRYAGADDVDDQDREQRHLGVVVPDLAQQACAWVPVDPEYWRPRPADVPLVVHLDR